MIHGMVVPVVVCHLEIVELTLDLESTMNETGFLIKFSCIASVIL